MSRLPSLPAALLAAGFLGLAPAAQATPDFTVPTVICVPGNTQTMNAENKPLTAGVTRQAGRNTPPRMYYCPVFNPDFTASQPTWRHLRLTYSDNSAAGGNIMLRLFAKSRAKSGGDPPLGDTALVAQLTGGPTAGAVSVATARLPVALDFYRFSYWLVLDLGPLPPGSLIQLDAHELQLTD